MNFFVKLFQSPKSFILCGAIVLYLISLLLPGFGGLTSHQIYDAKSGYQILIEGWEGITIGIFAWCSNLFFALSLLFILYKRYKEAFNCAVIGFLIGLQSFLIGSYPIQDDTVTIDHLLVGYYVWELSFIFLSIYSYLKYKENKNTKYAVVNLEKTRKNTAISIFGVIFVVISIGLFFTLFLWQIAFGN